MCNNLKIFRVLNIIQKYSNAIDMISMKMGQDYANNGFLCNLSELPQDFFGSLWTFHGVNDDYAILSFYHNAVGQTKTNGQMYVVRDMENFFLIKLSGVCTKFDIVSMYL